MSESQNLSSVKISRPLIGADPTSLKRAKSTGPIRARDNWLNLSNHTADRFRIFRTYILKIIKKTLFVSQLRHVWPWLTSDKPDSSFFQKLMLRASFWGTFCYLKKNWNLIVFSRFLTSDDLRWPWDPVFWNAYVLSVILMYIFRTLRRVLKSTQNDS